MRLICPNCAAHYEIDAALVPAEGREVQCSNCGHTWHEGGPSPAARVAETVPPPDVPAWDDDDAMPPPGAADMPPPRRRELDEATRAILREEAAREAAERRRAAARNRGAAAETSARGEDAAGPDAMPEPRLAARRDGDDDPRIPVPPAPPAGAGSEEAPAPERVEPGASPRPEAGSAREASGDADASAEEAGPVADGAPDPDRTPVGEDGTRAATEARHRPASASPFGPDPDAQAAPEEGPDRSGALAGGDADYGPPQDAAGQQDAAEPPGRTPPAAPVDPDRDAGAAPGSDEPAGDRVGETGRDGTSEAPAPRPMGERSAAHAPRARDVPADGAAQTDLGRRESASEQERGGDAAMPEAPGPDDPGTAGVSPRAEDGARSVAERRPEAEDGARRTGQETVTGAAEDGAESDPQPAARSPASTPPPDADDERRASESGGGAGTAPGAEDDLRSGPGVAAGAAASRIDGVDAPSVDRGDEPERSGREKAAAPEADRVRSAETAGRNAGPAGDRDDETDGDDRVAGRKGEATAPGPDAPPRYREGEPLPRGTGAAARDGALPDVDRIGSTLRPEAERTRSARNPDGTIAPHRLMPVPYMSPAEAARAAERRGFRWGFVLVLGVTFALIALYLGGPGLARAIPSIEPELAVYVDAVNAFRATLDGWLDAAARTLGDLVGG